jgi:hypothetical protein
MNTIQSGFFQTPSNTPSGLPKKVAVDNPYYTKDEFLTHELAVGLGITATSPIYTNGRLDRILLIASAEVNRFCRRWFDQQTIDETKVGIQIQPMNPQLVTVLTQNRPYTVINTIYIQVLKWFIQIDTSASSGYLQDFPDYGYYKIVPLLSNSGTGIGSPLPAEIVDKTPLGVLWTNYTFGFGTALAGVTMAQIGSSKAYQAPLYSRLWAPSQPTVVYDNGAPVIASNIASYDYPNGTVTFISSYSVVGPVTADYTSNESIPFDIKEAVALIAGEMIGQGGNNPLGASNYSIQTYSVAWKDKTYLRDRVERLLAPYENNMPVVI